MVECQQFGQIENFGVQNFEKAEGEVEIFCQAEEERRQRIKQRQRPEKNVGEIRFLRARGQKVGKRQRKAAIQTSGIFLLRSHSGIRIRIQKQKESEAPGSDVGTLHRFLEYYFLEYGEEGNGDPPDDD